jgi:hypothetical protein
MFTGGDERLIKIRTGIGSTSCKGKRVSTAIISPPMHEMNEVCKRTEKIRGNIYHL